MRNLNISAMLRTGGAAAMAQLLVLITMPIASRLFDETAFGVLGLMTTLSNVLVLTANFGYVDSVIAAKTDDDADDLVRLVICLAIFGAFANTALTIIAIHFSILGFGNLPYWATGFVVVQSTAIVVGSLFQQRLIRAQRYEALAGSHLSLGFGRAGGQISAGLMVPVPAGLVGAEVFSRVVMASFVIAKASKAPWRMHGSFTRIKHLAREFASYAAMRAGGVSLSTLSAALPVMIISKHFSLEEVGFVSFALAVVYAPIGLVQKAAGDVFTGTYRTALSSEPSAAAGVFRQMAIMLAILATLVGCLLWYFGEPLFVLIFGEVWAPAGRTAELFAPLIALMTLAHPLSTSLNILRRPDINLTFNMVRCTSLFAILFLAKPLELDYFETIGAVAGVTSVIYSGYVVSIFMVNRRATSVSKHV